MSDHLFNRHTCGCKSNDRSHHKQCGCRMGHDAHHQDFCSCHASRQQDTCRCKRVNRFPRNHFRRHDVRLDFNRRNRNGTSSSFARLSPLRHPSHVDDCFSHDHVGHLHENHSINETIRLNKDNGKRNIVIIM